MTIEQSIAERSFFRTGRAGKASAYRMSRRGKWSKKQRTPLPDLRPAEGASKDKMRALLTVGSHALQHCLAQFMLDEGADYKDLTAVLGHSSAVITEQFYACLGDERMLEVIETFAPSPPHRFVPLCWKMQMGRNRRLHHQWTTVYGVHTFG